MGGRGGDIVSWKTRHGLTPEAVRKLQNVEPTSAANLECLDTDEERVCNRWSGGSNSNNKIDDDDHHLQYCNTSLVHSKGKICVWIKLQ
ncbi:hypothetical protein V6N13_062189 [Hibiscus sabdariffa]